MTAGGIAHLEIPDFCAVVEELRHPEWKTRPLVLAEPGPRAVVQGVNPVARREGLREGMPLPLARRLCRRLLTTPPDLRFYRERHRHIVQELDRFSPLVEGVLPGRYFVDLTGTQRLWGPGPDVACRMERHLAERGGFHARVGLAANKLVSQVAAGCVPPGDLSCIFPGGEASFLNPLPVESLPGIGFKTAARLSDFNIQRIGQLAAMSAETLFGVFGKPGLRLSRIARGIDAAQVLPLQKIPRLVLPRDLDADEIDRERLEAFLFQQAEEAGWNLRSHNRCPGSIAVELRYADGVCARNRQKFDPSGGCTDRRLFRTILAAFGPLSLRRVAVRRIVLEFSDFSMPFRQLSLFPWDEAAVRSDRRLQEALDGIRERFGRRAVFWGRGGVPANGETRAGA